MTEVTEDGRVARGRRTRDAVIDALFDLYAEGNLTPTTEEIASRIGLTTRAVYHHFQNREALTEAIVERQLERHPQLFAARAITGTRTERIDGIVAHRAELFEAIAPVRRSALAVIHASPEVRTQQEFLAAHFRRQLAETFHPELAALDPDTAGDVLELVDLHSSWETWERLRAWQGLSVERSRLLVIRLVTQALER
jgi:AcrR family transcriptional regulator